MGSGPPGTEFDTPALLLVRDRFGGMGRFKCGLS